MSLDLAAIIKQPALFITLDEADYVSFLKGLRAIALQERQALINYLETALNFFVSTADADLGKYPRNDWGLLGKALELATVDGNGLSVQILKQLARSKKHPLRGIWKYRQLPHIVKQYLNPLFEITVKDSANNALLEIRTLVIKNLKDVDSQQASQLQHLITLKHLFNTQFKLDANTIYQQFLLKKAFELGLAAQSLRLSCEGFVICDFTLGFFDYLKLFKQLGITPPLGVDDAHLYSLLSKTLEHPLTLSITCFLDVAMHPTFYNAYLRWMQQLAYPVSEAMSAQSDRQQIAVALKPFLKIKRDLDTKILIEYPLLLAISLISDYLSLPQTRLKDLQKCAIDEVNLLLKIFIQQALVDSSPVKKSLDHKQLNSILSNIETQAIEYSSKALIYAFSSVIDAEYNRLWIEELDLSELNLDEIFLASITEQNYLRFSASGEVIHLHYAAELNFTNLISTAKHIIMSAQRIHGKQQQPLTEGDYGIINSLLEQKAPTVTMSKHPTEHKAINPPPLAKPEIPTPIKPSPAKKFNGSGDYRGIAALLKKSPTKTKTDK